MKKTSIIAVLLAVLAPMAQVWAGDSYYAALKTTVKSGSGKVYAANASTTEANRSYNASTSTSDTKETSSSGGSVSGFYAYAKPDAGWKFVKWTNTSGTTLSTSAEYGSISLKASTTKNGTQTTEYWAYFEKEVLPSFNITFETSSAGSYTVDGAAPANKTGLTEATTVTLASSDDKFLNWVINGTEVMANPYTASCTADTTISAVFLTADMVTSVTTLSDLTSALSNAQYKKITIPSGTTIQIPKGTTVTVPSGKQLVVDGTLVVLGTLSNSGTVSGNGTLYKISYLINQGEVITLYLADGTECGNMGLQGHTGKKPKYRKTTITTCSPSVSGTVSCTERWGVLLNGTTAYSISKQNPKAVKVSLNTASAVNEITAVTGDVDAISETSSFVLLADCSLNGPKASNGRYNFQGTVDCAGKTLTASGAAYDSNFFSIYLNGTIKFNGSSNNYFQNGKAGFFNCPSVTVQYCKNSGNSFYFYDCGTQASPCSVSFSYYSNTRTTDYRTAYFYNGYYNYTFNATNDGSGKCKVFGGSFKSDPSAYLSDIDKLEAPYNNSSAFYVVQEKKEVTNVAVIGETPYETLASAIDAAKSGDTISLIEAVDLTGETVEIPAAKNITIALDKHTVSGGKIVNRGTLMLTDSGTGIGGAVTDASGATIASDIENNGTLDIIFGSYSGAIVNKAGTLTTHNGIFSGTFTKSGGTVNLKGGHFTADVSFFVTATGYEVITYGGKNSVCELPNGTLYDTTIKSTAGYGATPYGTSDYNLLVKWVGGKGSRTDYSTSEWSRLAELLCFYQVFNSKGLDPTLMFDRDVSKNSVNLYAKSGSTETAVDFDLDVTAGTPYRALSEFLNPQYASKTFKAIFSESISTVGIAVSDKFGNNNGTLCKAMVELWEDVRASDYSSTGHKLTNTVYEVGAKYFVLGAGSNKAMIRPTTGAATFYSTLDAAMGAAADGGTVMLANDCDTALPLTKAGTYTFDTMGFAHSDDVSVGEGLFVKSATSVDSSAKVLIADAVAKTYVVAQKVASVGETFYDNLTEAVANANDGIITLLAATDETVTLGQDQSLKLAVASGVSYDTAHKIVADSSLTGYSVKATVGDGYTLYEVVQSAVSSDGSDYASVEEAISNASGDTVEVTVTGDITETVSLDAGKTLSVTVEEGVNANVAVTPAQGTFIETQTSGTTTTYTAKQITVEMAEPSNVASVEMEKIVSGVTNEVSDTSILNAAVAALKNNVDVSRTDNTDKLDILDVITVTPAKIVQEVVNALTFIRSATFDVVPTFKAGQSLDSLGEGQKLKFRLPVDAAATQWAAIVYHAGEQFGAYPVQTYNNEKFIEVESADFSPYGYTLLDGETANPVAVIGTTGYASLAAAVAAATAGDTITMLADDSVSLTNGQEIEINKSLTITGPVDANGKPLYTIYGTSNYAGYNDIFIKGNTAIDVTIENVKLSDFGDEVSSSTTSVPGVIWVSAQTNPGTAVTVSNVVISSFNYAAIKMYSGTLDVVDCLIDCAKTVPDATTKGLELGAAATASSVTPVVNVIRTEIINNTCDAYDTAAIEAWQNTKLTVSDCMITNVWMGIYACGSSFVTGDASGDSVSVMVANTLVEADAAAIGVAEEGGTTVPAAVSIQSGMFSGGLAISDEMADYGTFAISGGTFDDEVPEEYCADGFIPAERDPNTGLYTVKQGAYVAQIGDVKYETLAAALDAAQSGDTVLLLADITGVTDTFELRSKNITIDGDGHSIVAAENTTPRSVIESWGGARNMFVIQSGNVTFQDITLDGDETHYYTFLVQAKNGTTTFEDVELLHGGEADSSVTNGVGYGAAVQVDGATVLVSGSFHADTYGGQADGGIFPFTALLYQDGGIHFDDGVNVDIGQDLLLVGMMGAMNVSTPEGKAQVQEMLDAMNVPTGFAPYTLKLGDNDVTSFTGASPLGWNDIINYGKEIMDVSESLGMEMDKETTPVEVGLLEDTVLPETFTYEDSNFTINGNGNALSGEIKYTDNAGTMENVVLGTEARPLVLDMTDLGEGKSIDLGSGIAATNVTIKVTEEQATTLGQAIVTWDTEGESEEAAASLESGIKVEIVNADGEPVEDPVTHEPMEASIIWDAELGVAYIGPCEARLTGPTHESPIYTSLASAIARAADSGDTVTLMTNIVNFTGTQILSKQDLVIDGAGHTIKAAPVSTHRDVVNAWVGSANMFKVATGDITFRNITLDGDETHAYTFLISADNSGASITTENIRLLNGGEICGDAYGLMLEEGAGYGAAIRLNNGASLVVSNGFYACTGGKTSGVFPFTGILVDENGGNVKFELTGDPNDPANVDIGNDLLLVGMPVNIPADEAQAILDYMQVPSRFIPYTLTLGDGTAYAFTGASPLGWNDIIDYGKEIMEVSTTMGYEGLVTNETPVEVGLLTDTILPDIFTFADTNLTVNGNGNALSGEIKYTDNAGLIEDIVMGTESDPLVLDVTQITEPIEFGAGIAVTNVTIKMTEEQAEVGTPIIIWDVANGVEEPENPDGVSVSVVNAQGEPIEDPVTHEPKTASLIWDEELGMAYIGPCDARLTGPTHDMPIYTSLSNAVEQAAASGDTVTLMTNVTLAAVQTIDKDMVFNLNGKVLVAGSDALRIDSDATVQMAGNGTVTGNVSVAAGTLTITNGVYIGTFGKTSGDIVISGGFFSNKVLAKDCAAGYFPTEQNPDTGLYTVTQGYAKGDRPVIAGADTNALTQSEADFLNSLLVKDYDKATVVDAALAVASSLGAFRDAAMLNIDIIDYAEPVFRISAIKRSRAAGTVTVTVSLDRDGKEVSKNIYGTLVLKTSSDAHDWCDCYWDDTNPSHGDNDSDDDGTANFSKNGSTVNFTMPISGNGHIFKATISPVED